MCWKRRAPMRARGIDLSHWQGSFRDPGNLDFVIVKATEGIGYIDELFEASLPEVQKVPIRGAYHYFKTSDDGVAQAEHFHNVVRGRGFHFLVVDYESHGNTLDAAGEARLRACWNHLRTLTDRTIVLYTSPYVYRDSLCAYSGLWKDVTLWMAHYNGQDPETGSPTVFEASEWMLWQYLSTGKGADYGVSSRYVDLNVYHGTVEEMRERLGVLVPPAPQPPDVRAEIIRECIRALEELL
jgi:lysozyme